MQTNRSISKYLIPFILMLTLLSACNSMYDKGTDLSDKSDIPLENTYWKVTRIQGVDVVLGEADRDVFFQLKPEDKAFRGYGGCNQMMGSYELDGTTLGLSKVAATRKFCAPQMDMEQRYLAALGKVNKFEISGDMLRLHSVDGTLLFEMQAVYLK